MRSPPPEVLASWPKPNYVDPQRRGNEGVIVQAILVVLVTAIVIIRLYARIVITRAGIGLDDAMIIISWVRLSLQIVPARGLLAQTFVKDEADGIGR